MCVLEQHDQAGGCLHTFAEEGFEFDVGHHYIGGDVGNKWSPVRKSPVRKLYDAVTGGKVEWCKVEWCRLDDPYDIAVCTGAAGTGAAGTDAAENVPFYGDYSAAHIV